MPDSDEKTVLMADDDAEDCLLASEALSEAGVTCAFSCVEDGVELMKYLSVHTRPEARLPALILLDINMPRKDGREALIEIKSDPALKNIPIVILTNSEEQRDINFTMNAGAESFITKPVTFSGWIEIMKSLAERWLG